MPSFIDCSYHVDRLNDHIREQGEAFQLEGHPNEQVIRRWLEGDGFYSEVCVEDDDFENSVLEAMFDWDDLTALLRGNIQMAWISRNTFVSSTSGVTARVTVPLRYKNHGALVIETLDPEGSNMLVHVCSVTEEEPTEDWKNLFRIIAMTPNVQSIRFMDAVLLHVDFHGFGPTQETIRRLFSGFSELPLSPTTLKSCLEMLDESTITMTFLLTDFSEEYCRALASFGGRLAFGPCSLRDRGRAMLEAIGQNKGPTGLLFSGETIDTSALVDCLRRTTSLEVLSVNVSEALELVPAVAENRGLKEFRFLTGNALIPEYIWIYMMRMLLEHPTLEKLHVGVAIFVYVPGDENSDEEEENDEAEENDEEEQQQEEEVQQEGEENDNDDMIIEYVGGADDAGHHVYRAQAIADMLAPNTSLHALKVNGVVYRKGRLLQNNVGATQLDPDVFNTAIKPRLRANLFRKRIKNAIEDAVAAVRYPQHQEDMDEAAQERQLLSELISAHDSVSRSLAWLHILVSSFRDRIIADAALPSSDAEQEVTEESAEAKDSVEPG